MFNDLENNSDLDLEQPLITEIYQNYGSLALVFYKRAKENKLLEDSEFNEINFDLTCLSTMSLEINHFIKQIFDKITECISCIKLQAGKYSKEEKKEVTKSFELL